MRLLFVAMHKRWFRRRLLAELLPPLLPDGKSLLWEHLGRHFTGLDYTEADHISRKNKEFIVSLFPAGEIYATTLPLPVQEVIGHVGPQTLGVQKMLESVGFEFSHHIDPFDGGLHFEADVAHVSTITQTHKRKVAPADATRRGGPRISSAARTSAASSPPSAPHPICKRTARRASAAT